MKIAIFAVIILSLILAPVILEPAFAIHASFGTLYLDNNPDFTNPIIQNPEGVITGERSFTTDDTLYFKVILQDDIPYTILFHLMGNNGQSVENDNVGSISLSEFKEGSHHLKMSVHDGHTYSFIKQTIQVVESTSTDQNSPSNEVEIIIADNPNFYNKKDISSFMYFTNEDTIYIKVNSNDDTIIGYISIQDVTYDKSVSYDIYNYSAIVDNSQRNIGNYKLSIYLSDSTSKFLDFHIESAFKTKITISDNENLENPRDTSEIMEFTTKDNLYFNTIVNGVDKYHTSLYSFEGRRIAVNDNIEYIHLDLSNFDLGLHEIEFMVYQNIRIDPLDQEFRIISVDTYQIMITDYISPEEDPTPSNVEIVIADNKNFVDQRDTSRMIELASINTLYYKVTGINLGEYSSDLIIDYNVKGTTQNDTVGSISLENFSDGVYALDVDVYWGMIAGQGATGQVNLYHQIKIDDSFAKPEIVYTSQLQLDNSKRLTNPIFMVNGGIENERSFTSDDTLYYRIAQDYTDNVYVRLVVNDGTNTKTYDDIQGSISLDDFDLSSELLTFTLMADDFAEIEHDIVIVFADNPTESPIEDPTSTATEKKKKGGGCADCIPPTIGKDSQGKIMVEQGFGLNGIVVDAFEYHTDFPLIVSQTAQNNTIFAKIYENQGITNIKWVQFGFGLPEVGSPLNDAESLVVVYLDYGVFDRIETTDKDNLLDKMDVTLTPSYCRADSNDMKCLTVQMDYIFREAPINNIVVVNVVDNPRNSKTIFFNDGVHVQGDSLNELPTDKFYSKKGNQYPMITHNLVRTDKINDIWTDQFNIEYQKIGDNRYDRITPMPDYECNDKPLDEINVPTRQNCHFRALTSLWD